MASAAVGRSPVFTPSPSEHWKLSRTPQRRRSLGSTRTLIGSTDSAHEAPAARPVRSSTAIESPASARTCDSPSTPKRSIGIAWGAGTPSSLARHPTSQTSQHQKPKPKPEPEPEPERERTGQPNLADIRATFARVAQQGSESIHRAELVHALQFDIKLRSLLGLSANVDDAERATLQSQLQITDEDKFYLAIDDFVLFLVHHRLMYAETSAASTPAVPAATARNTAPHVHVQRAPVLPALRSVCAVTTSARANCRGLDTSASKVWPWQDGVNTAWSELEVELIAAIATCLKPREVVRAAGVCGSWRRVILRRCQIDTAWAAMFTEKFGHLPRDCVGTSAAQHKFLETESMLRLAFRTRKMTMSVHSAALGGWIYSISCGAGFVLAGSLCGAAALVDTQTGQIHKRLDGHRPTPPGKVGTTGDPAVTGHHQPAHHEQFYSCAVAAAKSLNENGEDDESDIQVILGSNHALRFVRLAACDTAIHVSNLDESEEEPEPEEVGDSEAQLSYEQFVWLVRRQCRIGISQCPNNSLRQIFDFMDKDRSGCISGSEFAGFLRKQEFGTFSVFETAMAHIEANFSLEKGYSVQSAFKAIDKDGSGALDVDELQAALSLLGLKLSQAEVMVVLAGLDEDGNGEISASEFSKGIKSARRRSKQRQKLAESKNRVATKKCEHTGNEKIESTDHLQTHELISTAFLRLYERLERKLDDGVDSSVDFNGARTASSLPNRVKKKRQQAAVKGTGNSVMRAFRELDEDGSGTLNARELRAAFAQLGVVLTRPVLAEVMLELDADGSGTVDMAELLDRAFVARLQAVRSRLISSAVLMSSTEDEWGDLFDRFARGQRDTMDGPTDPTKIERMTGNLDRNVESTSQGGVCRAPNIVATSEKHGWITHVALVGHGRSTGSKQWRAAETVAVAYQDGTIESWSITRRLKIWAVPKAHGGDGSNERVLVGLAVIGKGHSRLEEISPAATGQPPVFENAIIVSVGRYDGIQLRNPSSGECLGVIDTSCSIPPQLKLTIPSADGVEITAACTFRRFMVCGGSDGMIRAWSLDGTRKYTLLPERPLLPHAREDTTYASSNITDNSVGGSSAHESSEIGRIVCMAANGDRIAAVDAYGALRIWEPTCFTDHIPLSSSVAEDTPQARARQRYFSPPLADTAAATAMVAPQFVARHGEPGWLAHPIWSLCWDGPCKLWCGLESGQLAKLDFSEQATQTAPLVFRPTVKKRHKHATTSLQSKRELQRRRTIDRLAQPSPRWSRKIVANSEEKIGRLFGQDR